jgi:hypothetical protein
MEAAVGKSYFAILGVRFDAADNEVRMVRLLTIFSGGWRRLSKLV